jgi:hypothetical protein
MEVPTLQMQEDAVTVVEIRRDEVGILVPVGNLLDQPAPMLFQLGCEQTEMLKGFAVEIEISANRGADCRLNACRYHFLEVLIERLSDAHGGSIPRVAWNQKIGLTDWVAGLEIEMWIRTGCLQAVAKSWGVEEIRMCHLLEKRDLVLAEIRCAHVPHLSPRLAPFLDQVQYFLVASVTLSYQGRGVIGSPH